MVRLVLVVLVLISASCFAGPSRGERVKRHGYDFSHGSYGGGHGGGHGGYGAHGFPGQGFGVGSYPLTQSYSQSKASASASSSGGTLSG